MNRAAFNGAPEHFCLGGRSTASAEQLLAKPRDGELLVVAPRETKHLGSLCKIQMEAPLKPNLRACTSNREPFLASRVEKLPQLGKRARVGDGAGLTHERLVWLHLSWRLAPERWRRP
jgi:hypothetical protein